MAFIHNAFSSKYLNKFKDRKGEWINKYKLVVTK